jgi:hypothetical protein
MERKEVMEFMSQLSEAYQQQDFKQMSDMLASVTDDEAIMVNDEVVEGLYAILLHMRKQGLIAIRDNVESLGALIIVFALGRLFEAAGEVDTDLTTPMPDLNGGDDGLPEAVMDTFSVGQPIDTG